MIFHFLKRDFEQLGVTWIILAFVSVVALAIYYVKPNSMILELLGLLYFIFPSFVHPNIIGTVGRSEMALSRSYLHSLPVSKKQLYLAIFIRFFIFYLPLWVFCSILATSFFFTSLQQSLQALGLLLLFSAETLSLLGWSVCSMIYLAIQIEESWRFSSSLKRIFWVLKIGTGSFLQMGIILISIITSVSMLLTSAGGREVGEVIFFFVSRLPNSRTISGFLIVMASSLLPTFLFLRLFFKARKRWVQIG